MAKVKRQTYTLNMYLEKLKDMDIRSDADVPRLSGAWNNAMTNKFTGVDRGWASEVNRANDVQAWELQDFNQCGRTSYFLPGESEGCGRECKN